MPEQTTKPASPFCLRLTPEERATLEREAAGLPLGEYIRGDLCKIVQTFWERNFRLICKLPGIFWSIVFTRTRHNSSQPAISG